MSSENSLAYLTSILVALTIFESSLIYHFPSISFICLIKSKMVDHGEMNYRYNTIYYGILIFMIIYYIYFLSILFCPVTSLKSDTHPWTRQQQMKAINTVLQKWHRAVKKKDERGLEHSPSFSLKLTIAFSQTNQILLSRSHSTSIYLFQVNFSKIGHWHLNNYVEAKVSYSFDYNISQSVIQEPHA